MSSKLDSKLYNIYYFGDIKSSEKIFGEKDLIKELEIHGEKINLNIIEHLDISIISKEDQRPNGILLFYNVNDIDSFNKLKETIEKLIDMNKYEMPLIVVGNNSNNQERKVSFDEANIFLDKYGIKYHEINIEENFNFENIFNDLGEQVLYQDVVENNENQNNNIKNDEDINKNANNNNEDTIKPEESLNKNIDNEIDAIYKEESLSKSTISKNTKEKKQLSVLNKPFKPKIKLEQNNIKEKKTLAQIKREELVREKRLKREKEMKQWYKKKENEGIELKKKKEKEGKIKLFEKIKEDKEIQKKKEKEIKEEFSNQKKERYEKSKKEIEQGEQRSLMEKEKNKIKLEQKLKSEKANFKRLLQQKEKNEKDLIEKKRARIFSPSSSTRYKTNQSFEFDLENKSAILNNTISEFTIQENEEEKINKTKKLKNLKRSQNININKYQTLKKHKTTMNVYEAKSFRNNNRKKYNTLKEVDKNKEKEKKEQEDKEILINKIEQEKEEKENKIKEELELNYINNSDIYRCIFCSRIPLINLNQYKHLINIKCCCNNYINGYNDSFNYELFSKKSLEHSINENNIICYYCETNLNDLKVEDKINIKYCDFCNHFICSKDDIIHNNYHNIIENKELKEKYKKIFFNKNKINRSKTLKPRKSTENKNKLNTSLKDTKSKKRSSTPKKGKNSENNNSKSDLIKTEEINKDNNILITDKKVPLYLIDSCCIFHNKINKSYCYNCNKNICELCEENHKDHHLIYLEDIEIKEEDIIKMKQKLEKEIESLKNINDYFFALIEKLKKEFIYLYELKQKEIEIKKKIIHDYEIIKYNYNSIQNVKNNMNKINFEFNYNRYNNKTDGLAEINSIFNLMKNSNNIYNFEENILEQNIEANRISSMIKLNDNHIALSSFDGFIDIYNKNLELILTKKIFEGGEGINNMIQLKNGDLALTWKNIKIIDYNLENKTCDVIYEINIGNGFVNFIQDFGNNILVIYDTNHELKVFKNYKFIYKYNNINNIDNLYKINDTSFLTYSVIDNNLNLVKIGHDNIFQDFITYPLSEEMHIKKGKNSLVKLNDSLFVFIYEKEKYNKSIEEKFEESKNNEDLKLGNGLCLMEIFPKNNNFNIMQNIENLDGKKNYIYLANHLKDQILVIDDSRFIEIWGLDNRNKKLFFKNKIIFVSSGERIINVVYFEENQDIFLQTKKKILKISNYYSKLSLFNK